MAHRLLDLDFAARALEIWGRILDALPNVSGQDAATSQPGRRAIPRPAVPVYHLSNGPNGGGTSKREVAIDKLTFNSDGSTKAHWLGGPEFLSYQTAPSRHPPPARLLRIE